MEQPTNRQLTIISMCAEGMSRDEIGRELYISLRTVRQDLDELRSIMQAYNVTHTLSKCIVSGHLVIEDGEVVVASARRDLAFA